MVVAARIIDKTDNRPPLISKDQLAIDFASLVKEVAEIETAFEELPSVAEDDEDLALITGAATQIIKLAKKLDETKKEEKRPYLDAGTAIEAFFTHDLGARLATIKRKLESVSTAFQRKKAERERLLREREAELAREKAAEAARQVRASVAAGDVKAATSAVTESNRLTDFANRATAAAAAPTSALAKVKTDAGTASLADNWTFDDIDINTIDLETLRPFITQAAIEQALRAFIKAGRREIKGARIFNDSKSRFRG